MKPLPPFKAPAEQAARFGCTVAQADRLMRANLASLREMHAKAVRTGRKVGNSTAEELAVHIQRIEAALS